MTGTSGWFINALMIAVGIVLIIIGFSHGATGWIQGQWLIYDPIQIGFGVILILGGIFMKLK